MVGLYDFLSTLLQSQNSGHAKCLKLLLDLKNASLSSISRSTAHHWTFQHSHRL